jgi:hypothetical protein
VREAEGDVCAGKASGIVPAVRQEARQVQFGGEGRAWGNRSVPCRLCEFLADSVTVKIRGNTKSVDVAEPSGMSAKRALQVESSGDEEVGRRGPVVEVPSRKKQKLVKDAKEEKGGSSDRRVWLEESERLRLAARDAMDDHAASQRKMIATSKAFADYWAKGLPEWK